MAKFKQNGIGKIRTIIIFLFLCFASYVFFYSPSPSKSSGSEKESTPSTKTETEFQQRQAKYSEFPHGVRQHANLACNSCHKFPSANWRRVRKKDEAFPDITDYPKHESCLNCHRQQFFGTRKPVICSICHTNPGPRNSARHPFPNPREIFDKTPKGQRHVTDFEIFFPHDKHIEIVSENKTEGGIFTNASFVSGRGQSQQASCAICHLTYQPQGESDVEYVTKPPENLGDAFWLKKGTFKTLPISHAKCFTCHSPDTGIKPAPTNCATCHKLKRDELKPDFEQSLATKMGITDKIMLIAWRSRHSAGTFRHEFSSHADLECTACHNVEAMNTLDDKTTKVNITSCNLCHITATSDDGGVLNSEVDSRKSNPKFECVKCHLVFGKMPIPQSHFDAITAAGQ